MTPTEPRTRSASGSGWVPSIATTRLGGSTAQPVLVVGPSLGTVVAQLWETCVTTLIENFQVIGWDLPGHGSSPVAQGPFDMAALAAGVLAALDRELGSSAAIPFAYAGDSVGGAVGLQLLLVAPQRLSSASLICTGARIGTPQGWTSRACLVRDSGLATMVETSADRWFDSGFLSSDPGIVTEMLLTLSAVQPEGYAQVCDALASFDVRDRIAEICTPVLAIAGESDIATPPEKLQQIAAAVRHGQFEMLPAVGHLAPIEAPAEVARLITALALAVC